MRNKKREGLKPGLRYAIMQRDAFACCLCGRNPREDKIKLEVDHRISVADGGANTPNNLWTLCFDCNRGKFASSLALEYTPPPLVIESRTNRTRSTIGTTAIYARVMPEISDTLKEMAKQQGCSISSLAENILRIELEKKGKLQRVA